MTLGAVVPAGSGGTEGGITPSRAAEDVRGKDS